MVQQRHNIELRFNPDEECRSVALDFIVQYLCDTKIPIKKLQELTKTNPLPRFFKSQKLSFIYFLPVMSFLSPVVWMLAIKQHKIVSSRNKLIAKKEELKKRGIKHLVLYHLNPKQLYGIEGELWTHYVVGFRNDKENFEIYDPLKNIIRKDYNIKAPELSELKLDNFIGIKILIWNSNE